MRHATLPGEPPVEITLRRSARARRISLRVSALDGRVTLSMPKHVPEADALAFAHDKAEWIRRHLGAQAVPELVRNGSEILFEGQRLQIATGSVARARREGDTLLVPPGDAMVAARVKAFLKLEARSRLSARASHYAAQLGKPVTKVTLRDTRSRWGSCSCNGNLMFSWRLIMAPPNVLDYVAAHEVAHLVEMNHSPAYWKVVARICPDHARERAWLRKNGSALHRYRFDD